MGLWTKIILKMISKKQNKECISNKIMVYCFKYGVIPVFITMMLAVFFMLAINAYSGDIIETLILFLLILLVLFISILFFRIKIVYMDSSGLFVNDNQIPWTEILKLHFLYISPPFIIIKYQRHFKKKIMISIVHFFKQRELKERIKQYIKID
jgi:hypothetical protein